MVFLKTKIIYIIVLVIHIFIFAPYLISSANTFNVIFGITSLIILIYKTIKQFTK